MPRNGAAGDAARSHGHGGMRPGGGKILSLRDRRGSPPPPL